jgi:protein ImuB
MRRVASVWLPTWPTDRLRRTSRAAAPPPGRPFVTAARHGAVRVLVGVDLAARAAGLRSGMSVPHAHALVAGLVVADADPAADAAALRGRFATWAARCWSPIVGVDPPDGLLLDATGCAHLFGGEETLLARLVATLHRAGVAAHAAIADTPGAAHAVARFGAADPIAVVPPGGAGAALADLPVAALRLDPETAAELRRFGFKRVGQLHGEPTAPLTRRFGPDLVRRLDQALGRGAPEPITPVVPEDAPRRRRTFAEPIGASESLAAAAVGLTRALCAVLEAKGCGARRLDLLVERVDRLTIALRVGTARPSRDPRHLARLLTDRIGAIDPGFGVEAMTLVAARTQPLAACQLAAADATADAASWPADLARPFWLFAPEPVQAVALLPDDPPARFTWRGRAYRVRRADGPERICLEWWRRPAEVRAVRDYYRVEDADGGRFWLFRAGRGNAERRWFVHGVFG